MGIQNTIFRIGVFWNDKEKKPYPSIFREVFQLWRYKRRFPIHYFGRFLYRREIINYLDYLDMYEYRAIIHSKELNNPEYVGLLGNKLQFAQLCEKEDIPSPTLLGFNELTTFQSPYLGGKLSSLDELKSYFHTLFTEGSCSRIFIKSFYGYGGKEVFQVKKEHMENELMRVGPKMIRGCFIHQEAVVQHPVVADIYSYSLNSIRFETFISKTGETFLLGVFMRFGYGGSVTDNVSSGGFYVPLDQETGMLGKQGFQSMIFGGRTFTSHPDSKVTFEGFRIPFFEESKALVHKLCRLVPNRLAGWDIAISETGPLVIEGNATPGILIGEMAYGGFASHPMYSELMEYCKK